MRVKPQIKRDQRDDLFHREKDIISFQECWPNRILWSHSTMCWEDNETISFYPYCVYHPFDSRKL